MKFEEVSKMSKENLVPNCLFETQEVLNIIAKEQMDTAPVKLSIGTVDENGMVVAGGVYIKDCPARIIQRLQEKGFVLNLDDGELTVLYKEDSE